MASPHPKPEQELLCAGVAWVHEHQRYPQSREMGGNSGLPGETAMRHRYRSLRNYHRALYQHDPTLPPPPGERRGGTRRPGAKEGKFWEGKPETRATPAQKNAVPDDRFCYDMDTSSWLGPPQRLPQGRQRVGGLRFGEPPQARPLRPVLVQIRRW